MSRICENCGNMIPDDASVCPVCGGAAYRDTEPQDLLRDLESMPEENDMSEDNAAMSVDESPTTRIPDPSELLDEADEPQKPQQDPTIQEVIHSTQEKQKHTAPQRRQETGSGQKKRSSTATAGEKATQKKNHGAAAIGIVIGLLIALLVIGCGVAFMLYQMGFFVQVSDEELLQLPSDQYAEVEQAPSPEPAATVQPMEPAERTSAEESAEEMAFAMDGQPADSALEPEEVSETPGEPVNCTSFTLTGAEYNIMYSRGETMELSYVIEPSDLRSKIKWKSSNEAVASIDALGVIRARRGGETKITGTCGDKSISAYVTCDFSVPDTVLDMNMEDITMSYEGQTAELKIDYELTEEQINATVWESSAPEIAAVDKNGVVTAVANGTAIITASIADYTASCIVRCVNVTGNRGYNSDSSPYVINYEDVTLSRKGEYFQLTLKSVSGGEVPAFAWLSDDPSVATVDGKGVVTAVSDGIAYITTSIGQDKFQCIVRVNISD